MNLLNHPRHILSEAFSGIRTQVNEDESFPYIRSDRFQSEFAFVDVVKVGLVGHPRELPGRIESPTVKAANEPSLAKPFILVHQPIAAMNADVMEGPYFLVFAANQQDGSVSDRKISDY